MSDGQRSLLLLHGLLVGAFDRASMAFLDEPELGLAPHEMQPWLAQATAALDEHDGQLFVISHHPAVVDYLAPERTLRFSRPRGGPTRIDEITLETTGGVRVSEWLSRSWAYEDDLTCPRKIPPAPLRLAQPLDEDRLAASRSALSVAMMIAGRSGRGRPTQS
ncbi:MAG: ATP-binding protein [Nannocystis sp.]|nr:AAA family ATPase [Nannocystis sp.]MBK9752784.1 ATP-binding protein [Nannocystis sp.]